MLTEDEGRQLADLLEKATWPLPFDAFLAFCANNITAGVDLALIRKNQILLTRRPINDPYFAGMWHIPGGVVIPGETALSTLQKRVIERDLKIALPREPEFLTARDIIKGPPGRDTSPRGQEVYRCFHYQLREEDPEILVTETMQFFPLDEIPGEFIQHQLPIIEKLRAVYGV